MTTKLLEALTLAEETLRDIVRVFKFETGAPVEALAALREQKAELGKPLSKEPVAYINKHDLDFVKEYKTGVNCVLSQKGGSSKVGLYDFYTTACQIADAWEDGYKAASKKQNITTAPQPVKQEPVAFRFPRDTESWTGGWTIDHKVIRSVDAEIEDNEFKPCLEGVEQVLLALEKVYAASQTMKQEPVAWMCWIDSDEEMNPANAQLTSYEPKAYAKRKPLYAAPQPVKQEPVAFTNKEQLGYLKDPRYQTTPIAMWATPFNESVNIPLYAAPVRTKDLTDEEIEAAVLSVNTTMEAWITYRAVICREIGTLVLCCDEPGCDKKSTCGTNTESGYRRTCFAHMPTRKQNDQKQ